MRFGRSICRTLYPELARDVCSYLYLQLDTTLPELVGGKDGQMIGNWIAYHLKTTLNWGLCAALGAILLGVLTVLYWVYNKLVGIENIKLG